MNKHYFLFLLVVLLITNSHAQTLFTIAGKPVTKQEFLDAYKKNEAGNGTTSTSLNSYLDLFINYKLKVHAAREQGLDTSEQQASDLSNYRQQVILDQLRKSSAAQQVLNETMRNASKDILTGHIFIPVNYNTDNEDEQGASKINEAYKLLQGGASFEEVAVKYSKDPNVEINKGVIGFVTALVLPYEIESVLFATKPGSVSQPFQTKYGWHIVRNFEERKAAGRVSVSQVLLAFPPSATEQEKASVKKRADSIHLLVLNGAEFSEIATLHSDDMLSRSNGGELPFFSVGIYADPFQQQAFNLSKEGDISSPFESQYGYHILKLNKKFTAEHPEMTEVIKQEFNASGREDIMMDRIAEQVKATVQYKKGAWDEVQLEQFTRNVLRHPGSVAMQGLRPDMVLFSIGSNKYSVEDYRKSLVEISRSGNKTSQPAALFYKNYEHAKVLEQYSANLEKYDPEFKRLMQEFSDGNLLFTAMNANVWEKASSDTNGLKKFFEANRQKYWWQKSVDAIIFSSGDELLLKKVHQQLAVDISGWKELADQYQELLLTDSSRVEIDQLPVSFDISSKLPLITEVQKAEGDESFFFAYIHKVYDQKQQRDFKDAQGLVLSDYQEQLEKEWINELKKKYPVKINEKELGRLAGKN